MASAVRAVGHAVRDHEGKYARHSSVVSNVSLIRVLIRQYRGAVDAGSCGSIRGRCGAPHATGGSDGGGVTAADSPSSFPAGCVPQWQGRSVLQLCSRGTEATT